MPLPPEHYEPAVVLPDVTKLNKKTEKSTVAGGAAPAGYFETLVNEGPRVAQQVASTAGKAIASAVNPIHYKDNGDVDLEASGMHLLGDAAAYRLGKAVLKRAFTSNPLNAQVAATLKTSNDLIQNAAAERAHQIEVLAAKQKHELELAKLKAAGVPAQAAAPLTAALTTPLPSTQGQAETLADLNAARAATAPPAGTPLNPIAPAPEAPTVPLNTEVGKEPAGMGLVEAGKQNTLQNEMVETRKTGINPFEGATELRTGTGKAAYEGMNPEGKLRSTYNSIKDVPKGLAFIPNAQYIDVLRTDLGQPTYTENFKGREFPTQYRGAPEAAVETAQKINRGLGRETRESLLARGVPKSELPNVTPGILQRIGGPKGSKIVTIGGAIGALTAIPNLANAAQNSESLRQGLGNIAEALLPIGMTPSELAPSTLTEKQLNAYKEAQKLGSPYRSVPPPR
jgi:hypothetical protein